LKDSGEKLAMPLNSLKRHIEAIGESLLCKLLAFFVDGAEPDLSRRWAGLLLAELLGISSANRSMIWEAPEIQLYGRLPVTGYFTITDKCL
jgi:hypothetical protein